MTGRPATLSWWQQGEQFFGSAVAGLGDADIDQPSLLPDWSRRRVLAHVARNADALVNLLTWAATGVETPMYASADAREAGIRQTEQLSVVDLRAEVAATAARLADAVAGLDDSAWAAEVRTAQGRTVPASAVPWMRCREVWVHAVDLAGDSGATSFDDVPDDVAGALVDDVFRMWAGRNQVPAVTVQSLGDLGDGHSVDGRHWGTAPFAPVTGIDPVTAGPVTETGPGTPMPVAETGPGTPGTAGAVPVTVTGPVTALAAPVTPTGPATAMAAWVTVTGPVTAVAAWVTGRSDGRALQANGPLPTLPAWL